MTALRNKKILITAGPTREYMDPVRFISNPSSGSVGMTLASALARRGARVTLVCGPTHLPFPPRVKTIGVVSGLDMHAEVKKRIHEAHAFIATAAVCDWRFKKTARRKMKKGTADEINVRMVKNPDILGWVGEFKRRQQKVRHPRQEAGGQAGLSARRVAEATVLVGFALETNEEKNNALQKLKKKNLDLVIGNSPASFSVDKIKPLWIEASGMIRALPRMKKSALAEKISEWLEKKLS